MEDSKKCDKAVDYFLPALKFVPDWFTSTMIKKLLTTLYADANILYFNEYSQCLLSNAFNVCNIEVLKHFATKT